MKAELLFHERIEYEELWRVPSPVPRVGYDNERGNGDHRHFQGAETPYAFSSAEQLMADFWSDVRGLRGGK